MPEADKLTENVKVSSNTNDRENFEWLEYADTGNHGSRLSRTLLSNPLVPLGAGATVIALFCGLYYMRQNNSVKQQFFMRCRVGAQSFTIASLLGGLFYESHKKEVEEANKLNQARMS